MSEVSNSIEPLSLDPDTKNFHTVQPCYIYVIVNVISVVILCTIGLIVCIAISASSPDGLQTYASYCTSNSNCNQDYYLICQDYKCVCPSTMYYQGPKCTSKLSYLASCSSNDQCGYGLNCTNNICNCTDNEFWKSFTSTCVTKFSYGATGCSKSSECATGTNLQCISDTCVCSATQFWNSQSCVSIKSYLGDCTTSSMCNSTQLLSCSLYNQTVLKCVCSDTQYWSSTQKICVDKNLNGVSCTSDTNCRADLGLYCDISTTPGLCLCSSKYYWTGSTCYPKQEYAKTCSASLLCDDTLGFVCTMNTCSCPANYFYNLTGCQKMFNFGFNCGGLYYYGCDTSKLLMCEPTILICDCPVLYYWSHALSSCVNKLYNSSACTKDIQCRTDLLLYCDSTYGACLCPSTYYWDTTALNCVLKKPRTSTCAATYECQDYLNLVCSGTTCTCPTDTFWNGAQCINQYKFPIACTTPTECLNSKGLTCNSGICSCTVSTEYWDGTDCVTKLGYSSSCHYQVPIYSNNECDDTVGLICLATPYTSSTWTCQCTTLKYWDGTQCTSKVSWNAACTASTECLTHLGLFCSGGFCVCGLTQYWSTTNSICTQKLSISATTCTSDSMCKDYVNMICDLSSGSPGVCSCQTGMGYNSNYDICETYASHDQFCGSGTPCLPSTPGLLTCVLYGGLRTCQCQNYNIYQSQYYWSTANSKCAKCPTNYLSGYGMIGTSTFTLTTRCYYYSVAAAADYSTAQGNCQNNNANLMTIRTANEMAVAASFAQPNKNLWVGSSSSTANSFSWDFGTPNVIQSYLWLRDTITYPSQTDCTTTKCAVIISGSSNPIALKDDLVTSLFDYICELDT